MPGVSVTGLTKRYGDVTAVDDLTLDFPSGTLTTLLGPSGCGKTTTLRCIAGLERPDMGTVALGKEVVFSRERNVPPERRNVGIVFQSYAIWPHMTVFENVAFPLRIRHLSGHEVDQKVKRAIDLVRLSGLENRPATEVSGGQQQRVALARALVFDPEVLLLDEPLSNLDASLRDEVRVEVREIQRSLGITTVYVTHDQAEALSISDTIAVMNRGRIVAKGTPREIYNRPANDFVASFVGKSNLLVGKAILRQDEQQIVVVQTEIGRVNCSAEGIGPAPGEEVIVAIRPENVAIIPKASGPQGLDPNVFHGRVQFMSYLGAYTEVLVQVADKAIKVLGISEALSETEEGLEVLVALPEGYCSLVRSSTG